MDEKCHSIGFITSGGVYGKSDKPEELKQLFVQVHDYGGGTTVRHVLEAAPQYNFFPRRHK